MEELCSGSDSDESDCDDRYDARDDTSDASSDDYERGALAGITGDSCDLGGLAMS